MSTFLENPIPIILLGILAEAVLGVMLVRTGRGVLLWAMAGVLLLVSGGVLLERMVVTEVERVEATFDSLAAALEANDSERVLAHIHPSAADTRHLASWGLRQVEFTEARITHLDIDVIDTTSPPTAKVSVMGIVHFRGRSGLIPRNSYPLNFTVTLRRESGRWVITGHKWANDPRR